MWESQEGSHDNLFAVRGWNERLVVPDDGFVPQGGSAGPQYRGSLPRLPRLLSGHSHHCLLPFTTNTICTTRYCLHMSHDRFFHLSHYWLFDQLSWRIKLSCYNCFDIFDWYSLWFLVFPDIAFHVHNHDGYYRGLSFQNMYILIISASAVRLQNKESLLSRETN